MILHEWVLVGLLLATLCAASLVQYGREKLVHVTRMTWMAVGLVVVTACGVVNPWLAVMGALIGLNVKNHPKPSTYIQTYLYPTAAMMGVYSVAIHGLTAASVVPLLWGLVGLGIVLGCWGCYSLTFASFGKGYWHYFESGSVWPWMHRIGNPRFFIWETNLRVECGLSNPLHTQAVSVMSAACAVGLGLLGSVVAWGLVPLLLVPMVAVQLNQPPKGDRTYHGFSLTQGPVHLAMVGLAGFPLWLGWRGVLLALCLVVAGFFWAKQWDNNRTTVWRDILVGYWWEQGWWVKLLGCGTGAWVFLHSDWMEAAAAKGKTGRDVQELYTSAHNEYVQQLAEHGLIGFVALVAFVGTSLYDLAHAGPVGIAVYLPAVVLASVCFLHFPLDYYHEAMKLETVKTDDGRLVNIPKHVGHHGSTTTQMVAVIVVILVELARWGG